MRVGDMIRRIPNNTKGVSKWMVIFRIDKKVIRATDGKREWGFLISNQNKTWELVNKHSAPPKKISQSTTVSHHKFNSMPDVIKNNLVKPSDLIKHKPLPVDLDYEDYPECYATKLLNKTKDV